MVTMLYREQPDINRPVPMKKPDRSGYPPSSSQTLFTVYIAEYYRHYLMETFTLSQSNQISDMGKFVKCLPT